jgi:hypothetical protein
MNITGKYIFVCGLNLQKIGSCIILLFEKRFDVLVFTPEMAAWVQDMFVKFL